GLGGKLLARSGMGGAPAAAGARIGAGVVATGGPDFYRPGTIYMACGAGGYVGLVRLEDGRLDLAAALDAARVRASGGPGQAAAGYVEPFTGEGIAWALAAGRAVAPLALRAARRWQPSVAREWEARYRRVVVRRQYACRAAAAVLRHPLLARALIRLLAHVPALARPFMHHLNGKRSGDRTTDNT